MSDSTEINKNNNETLVTELHFELLKQYAWLASAAIGGIVVMLQLELIVLEYNVYAALGLLALSIFISLFGQDKIVESLLKGKRVYDVSTYLGVTRATSMFTLGVGLGFLTGSFI